MNEKPEDTRSVAAHEVATVNEDVRLAVYIREIEAQAGVLRAVRSELAKAKKAAEDELAKCRSRISSLESEAGGLSRTLEEERKAARAAQDRFLDEVKDERERSGGLMARLEAMEAKKEEVVADNARLASENASLSTAQDRLLSEVKGARESNGALLARLEAMEAKKEEVAADNARLVSENARMEEALAASKGRVDDLSVALAAAQEGNDGLVARLEAMEAKNEESVADNAKLISENVRLAVELAEAKGRADDLSAALSASQDGSKQFKLKADRRFAEIAVLKERLKKSQAAEAASKGKAESTGRQLAAANRALRECRAREDARRLSKRFHRLAKGIMPYGFTCTWKRMAYGIVEDKPLLYYPGFFKRARRVVKFSLPYFVVAAFKRAKYAS